MVRCWLLIVHNSCELPDDLFEEGEVKPARPQKNKKANGTTKKRPATEVCDLLYLRPTCALFRHESFLHWKLVPVHVFRTATLTFIGLESSASEETADLCGCCWMILCEATQLPCLHSRIDRHLTTGFQRHSLTNFRTSNASNPNAIKAPPSLRHYKS